MDEELTVKETAERLGISTVQVWRLVKEGVLTSRPNALDRRERLIPEKAIEALERRGRRKRAEPAARPT
jgi:excisionase family DNA binding protein